MIAPRPLRTLLIDNYDSFTFNLFHYVAEVNGLPPTVVPNDWPDWHPAVLSQFDNVIISPGPGRPEVPADFGICADVFPHAAVPVLGICLGHEGLAIAYGGAVGHAPTPRHGLTSPVAHAGTGLFAHLSSPLPVVRYHSLAVSTVPPELEVIARAEDDDVIMALAHRTRPQWGVQFHPESLGTEGGRQLLANFAALTRRHAGTTCWPAPLGLPHTPSTQLPLRDLTIVPPPTLPSPVAATVAVHTFPSPASGEEVFSALFANAPEAVWLDSNAPNHPNAHFSIMRIPARVATANVAAGTVTVRDAAGTTTVTSPFFAWLEKELAQWHLTAPALPCPFQLGWVGYLGYELKQEVGATTVHHSPHPDAMLAFLDQAVVLDHQTDTTYLLALVTPERPAAAIATWFAATAATLQAPTSPTAASATVTAPIPPVTLTARHSQSAYLHKIAQSLKHITDGETYEVCLTNQLTATVALPPVPTYLQVRRHHPSPFGALLRCGDLAVLSTSPERFVRITAAGEVEAKPIKGTRPRGSTPTEDAALRTDLATARKDRAENLMIVDLVRHDLGRTAAVGSVQVPHPFAIESYQTVHQLVSTITAHLAPGASPVAAVRAAFPPGSMTGAPKLRTMDILDDLEAGPRGIYSGALGYFSLNGAVDLSVVIRTLVLTPDQVSYGVGGAIVALSDPAAEYTETVVKAAPLLQLFAETSFPEEEIPPHE